MARGKQKDRKASGKVHHAKPARDVGQPIASAEEKDAQEASKNDAETMQTEKKEQKDLILNDAETADAKETALNDTEANAPTEATEESVALHEADDIKEATVPESNAAESSEKKSD